MNVALEDAVTHILFKRIEALNECDAETEETKYFELYIDIMYSICLRGHWKPTNKEIYTFLKTHEISAQNFDFSIEDIHDVREITEDEACSCYGMEYIDTLP